MTSKSFECCTSNVHSSQRCIGTIISPLHVLTLATCFTDMGSGREVCLYHFMIRSKNRIDILRGFKMLLFLSSTHYDFSIIFRDFMT